MNRGEAFFPGFHMTGKNETGSRYALSVSLFVRRRDEIF